MSESLQALRDDVRMLGTELGSVIRAFEGDRIFDLVEEIRDLSKRVRQGDESELETLRSLLLGLSVEQSRIIARCFTQFLNLSNVAEQHHRIRRRQEKERAGLVPQGSLADVAGRLIEGGRTASEILETFNRIRLEVVLTAHPTEVLRRTILMLNRKVGELLAALDSSELTPRASSRLHDDLRRTIEVLWKTEEIRHEKPSAIYEARGGLMIFEQTIWNAVPEVVRRMEEDLEGIGIRQDPSFSPFRFGSWAGGDRDGNPNVTVGVTRRTALRARWLAAVLYQREISQLRSELSLKEASDELRSLSGDHAEPYREVLHQLEQRLRTTIEQIERALEDETDQPDDLITHDELWQPLMVCWRSLIETGHETIARGPLLDLLRRAATFGVTLAKLDIRQEAGRHDLAIAAATGLPFDQWPPEQREEWLLEQLADATPADVDQDLDPESLETLETFRMIGSLPEETFGAYVISMAASPADVLAVEWLQRKIGRSSLRVVPLFETLEDLQNARATMERLFAIDWYREVCGSSQEIMLGYSDSARDGSRLAANWALYQTQEDLAGLARREGWDLTIFHGRGGTISRGGGPTRVAIRSQPPESIDGRMRVTEQGEMIQARFGLEEIAERTLEVYVSSVLEATLSPSSEVKGEWRELMSRISATSAKSYREIVYSTPSFVEYFRHATPEPELGMLNIGSRPARRRAGTGVESLRAIPWVFAWTQTRLLLPAWLGADEAFHEAIEEGHLPTLREMYEQWPFFQSTIDLIEMVLAKSSPSIAALYDAVLVPDHLRDLGETLRERLARAVTVIGKVTGRANLLDQNPVLQRSIGVRNPYVDPINLIQVEVLRRLREEGHAEGLFEAFVTTVNGVAAGMRNTG